MILLIPGLEKWGLEEFGKRKRLCGISGVIEVVVVTLLLFPMVMLVMVVSPGVVAVVVVFGGDGGSQW